MGTPAPILLILAAKRDFVSSMLGAGKTPTPQQLASFLQALVVELLPHVKSASPYVSEILHNGLSALGWSAQTNAPVPGSSPPQPANILSFLDEALSQLLPDVSAARASAAAARRALENEDRELSMLEEEGAESSLSSKQERALAAARIVMCANRPWWRSPCLCIRLHSIHLGIAPPLRCHRPYGIGRAPCQRVGRRPKPPP